MTRTSKQTHAEATKAKHTPLVFHKGMDYAVILKPGQSTEQPLASVYGIDREVTKYGNLFAAAPEMLEALKAANLILLQQKLPYSEVCQEAMDVIQTAIAKAAGGAQ